MKTDRMLAGLIVMSCLLSLVAGLRPKWVGCHRPEAPPAAQAVRLLEPPDRAVEIRTWRIRLKADISQRLMEGRMTLLQAAAGFRALNAVPPAVHETYLDSPPSDDSERLCHRVIHWAEGHWRHNAGPAEVAACRARLEQELRDHIRAEGGVVLPEVIADDLLADR
ncbi:MAG: hypothetical protein ACRC33_04255 [Gemmataceae bacterium]